jgi:16S rRNA (cytosine967-C5)-methyltransferase
MIAAARRTAFDILRKVEAGGYASDLLVSETHALDTRDAGLAHEIVFGVLRYRAQLDFLITHYGARPKLDTEVRIALQMGIYQLRYLERIPRHAAVAESVELVKLARKRSAAGLVNAVLRKVRTEPVEWPNREVELSCPQWLLARWETHYGAEAAEGIARAALREPEKYTRGGRTQDIGSQSIVPLLDLQPGQLFLDVCAAPGNKTAQALESGVRAIACDLHPRRAALLKHLTSDVLVLDGTQPLPFARRFERILVDAPCSGTGTLGRNPEIKWRLTPSDLHDLQGRQRALLANALRALKDDGVLVYSTCSLEPEENEQVVAAVAAMPEAASAPGMPEAASPRDGKEAASARDTQQAASARNGEEAASAPGFDEAASAPGFDEAASAPGFDEAASARGVRAVETIHRIPGRDAGDGFFAAVIKFG